MKSNTYKENYEIIFNNFLVNSDKTEFKPIKYKPGEYVILSGQTLDSFYFVLNGKLRIFQDYSNGKTLLIRVFDPFTVLGDIEYFQNQDAMCTVQAIEEVNLIKVPYSYINTKYKDNLTFFKNILLQMSSKLLLTNEQALMNNVYTLDTRFASYLVSMADKKNYVEISSLVDIASHLGASYRHLTRTIKDLTQKGIIEKVNRTIKILDPKKLYEISEGNIYEKQIKPSYKR